MTTALVSAFSSDYRSLYKGLQSHRVTADIRQQVSLALERQLSGQIANSYASSLINLPVASQVPALSTLPNFPAKSSTKQHPPLTASNSVANCNAASHLKTVALKEHRKLDRSVSEPVDKSQQTLRPAPPSSSRYKTELCRPFEESGTCKYGDKCQFAHGMAELRTLSRHPKYKTELCRTFHSTGFCPYGPRCHFIHNSGEAKKYLLDHLHGQQSPPLSPVYQELRFEGIDYPLGYAADLVHPYDLGELQQLGSSVADLQNSSKRHRPGSTGDLSPNSSICSSGGSPTSPMGGFFSEDVTCTVPQHPEVTAARAVANRAEVFCQDYTPIKPLSALPSLIPRPSSPPPPPVLQDEALSTLEKLASDLKELDCSASLPFSNAECSAKPEPSAAVDINRNIRLPIFSKLSLGNSP